MAKLGRESDLNAGLRQGALTGGNGKRGQAPKRLQGVRGDVQRLERELGARLLPPAEGRDRSRGRPDDEAEARR